MKSHFENLYGVTALPVAAQVAINGGSEKKPSSSTSFWTDASFLVGAIAHGVVTFATEGGRNAGIVVR